ncbi:protein of unknown function DUF214 [Pirellula staleyi DSM 6068]|uniref:ABC3 transporter permease C-terminal domain-containing protein n=1 Tax=Pirellula staleyi (strain ATCC 27377 / DSM 6068 / ICPB 4128) TaxID=530564 RepID=D2R8T7_PIRSD|nr:ABC transporter permease [Pirellula staleyi]ADB17628.1 protein of unknown function DUF214 [Pirellula staleyi DSM 6068]
MKFFLLIFRNLSRNLFRTILTSSATMFLVLVITAVWTVLSFLDKATEEKKQDLKAIVTERWQIPSQLPFSYAATLSEGAARNPGDVRPLDSMTWQFYGGTTDKENRSVSNTVFMFCMEPKKLLTMMDELDKLDPNAAETKELQAAIDKMENNIQSIILGQDRLKSLEKRVGDRIKLYGINYKDIDLELEIVGTFPANGRYNSSAVINNEYLNRSLDAYEREKGSKHPLADKTLNLVWLRLPDTDAFNKVAEQITTSPSYSNPSVKCETASSGIAAFLDAYRDLIWAMRWLFSPVVLFSLTLVIANSISISVRERRLELAILKVLGFRPSQLLILVLGEGLLLGAGAGFLSTAGTYLLVNYVMGGIPFQIAFFPNFDIPIDALWWGPVLGGFASLLGSIVPSWNACTVKVTDVFSRVA